ncbi:hypothetical protein WICMUC_002015 [Wickerhamomyces mucosus]|uniref:Ribonuclease H2 subunit B n=1 Tax=Wickerhamomyces mucosus TaxID=1378264 RepID=A0A9P8TF07_9ASCO|nr:hypothetical protein WICMUC_002015 [Wickerhamomyces mucosus]
MTYQTAKVVFLPDSNLTESKILNFPHPRTTESHSYVLSNNVLFELKELDGDNPHEKLNHMRPTTKKDNLPVRSFILENNEDPENSVILENGNLILSTKYNFAYVLISYFTTQIRENEKRFSRYQSIEDFIEILSENIPSILELPESLVQKSLVSITDSIREGESDFYRYSEDKILQFLRNKVEKLSKNFPSSVSEKIVKPLLFPINFEDEIPEIIFNLALTKYSIFILSSYLHTYWTTKLLKSYDFEDLDKYIEKTKNERIQKKAVEDQLADINQLNAANKRANGKAGPVSKKPTPSKKVASSKLSRGPLDSFFAKKK